MSTFKGPIEELPYVSADNFVMGNGYPPRYNSDSSCFFLSHGHSGKANMFNQILSYRLVTLRFYTVKHILNLKDYTTYDTKIPQAYGQVGIASPNFVSTRCNS